MLKRLEIVILVLQLDLVGLCLAATPCSDYLRIDMADGFRSSDYYSENTAISLCDSFLDETAWYRFDHDCGNRLLERPIDPYYCGTQAPIWMNGSHPKDQTEVSGQVCSSFSNRDHCGWSGTIRIRLCNETLSEDPYFVYQLARPPGCPLAYCVDSATRRICVPPLIWLEDEFICGENVTKSTPAPGMTLSTTPRPSAPLSGWSSWGAWSTCSKPCDFGIQTRGRICGQLPCDGPASQKQLCNKYNCKELPEERSKGIVLNIVAMNRDIDTMLQVVRNENEVKEKLRASINGICVANATVCCGNDPLRPTTDIEYVTISDIYTSQGFPELRSDGTIYHKVIAVIKEEVDRTVCGNELRVARQTAAATPNYVSYAVMEIATINSNVSIARDTRLAIVQCLDPATLPDEAAAEEIVCPFISCILPIVLTVVVIILIVIVLIVMCKIYKMNKRTHPRNEPPPAYVQEQNPPAHSDGYETSKCRKAN